MKIEQGILWANSDATRISTLLSRYNNFLEYGSLTIPIPKQ